MPGLQDYLDAANAMSNYKLPLDYDYAGYVKNALGSMSLGEGGMHWPDTYKLPAHQTFSDQSQYANPSAGSWMEFDPVGQNNNAVYTPSMLGALTGKHPRYEHWRQ
jgi:hypothetical protein